jgi:hypothetical protein
LHICSSDWIFHNIGAGNRFYSEFGAEEGRECNTRYLREINGWNGLLMDGSNRNHEINLRQELVYPWNINFLFEKYEIPEDLDLLSIDLDFHDYWVWKHLDSKYKPRVVVLEVNGKLLLEENKTVDIEDTIGWLHDDFYGCSLKAAAALGQSKGYTLVYQESRGVNAFFIRNDILGAEGMQMALSLKQIYRPANHYNGRRSVHHSPQSSSKRKWIYNDLPYKP